jgi:hypothetical protein
LQWQIISAAQVYVTVVKVNVGMAQATGMNADDDFSSDRFWVRQNLFNDRLAEFFDAIGSHRRLLTTCRISLQDFLLMG